VWRVFGQEVASWIKILVALIFRSAPPSRPNNIRGRNVRPAVRTSLCTAVRKVFRISVKFGV